MNNLVSIIMPSYNTEKYIINSINSVINQTYQNWELIIVDDCSTDNTIKMIKTFNDPRIILLRNEVNSGAAVSRNKALKFARGKWIAFLDSDDLWKNNKLEIQIQFMESNDYNFSYTNYEEINNNGKISNVIVTGPQKINKRQMFNFCWPGCLTVMYNADEIGLIQIEDIKKNNDYAMWLKICKKTNCYLCNESLAYYRRGRDGSISSTSIFKLIKWHYKLFKECEHQNCLLSSLNVLRNLFYGLFKKVKYVKNQINKNN